MTTTPMNRIRPAATFAALLAVAFGLAGCSSASIEGTYFGSEGDTVLIMNTDNTCNFSQHYDEEDGVQDAIEHYDAKECTWTSSDGSYTLA